MANADNNDASQNQNDNNVDPGKGKEDALAQQLAGMSQQLAQMNERMEAQAQALIQAQQRQAPQQRKEEENLFEPQNLLKKAEQIFDTKLRENKNKDFVIYELSQEYPEIQTDIKLRQAVLDAQKRQPTTIQDTPEGYRLAVLEATARVGLVAKSQRKVVEDEPGYERRSTPKARAKVKLSAATLEAAELMGRDINDPKVIERLEAAANRDTYGKYR